MTEDQVETTRGVARCLAEMGLGVGEVFGRWSVASADRTPQADAAMIGFVRGRARVDVRIERARAGEACFARVDDVQLSHLPVEPGLTRHAGELMRLVVARLQERANSSELVRWLEAPSNAPAPAAVSGAAYSTESEAPDLDPRLEVSPDDPFMRFVTLDLADLADFPDALRHMYDGTLGGMVIKEVYSKAAMAAVTERLSAQDRELPRTSFPARWNAHFYGRCLDGADPALDEYLSDAARLRGSLEATFPDTAPFEARMEEIFRKMAGGRRVELPHYVDGRAYTPATVRILLEGGQIGTHCGNEAATRPAYTHLNTVVDPYDQLSYFLTLQDSIAGGELVVYSVKWTDIDASHIVGGRSQVDELLLTAKWMSIRPQAGDLLIFDGGRYFHRVSKVIGPRVRYTIGGFMMFRRGGETIYYWS